MSRETKEQRIARIKANRARKARILEMRRAGCGNMEIAAELGLDNVQVGRMVSALRDAGEFIPYINPPRNPKQGQGPRGGYAPRTAKPIPVMHKVEGRLSPTVTTTIYGADKEQILNMLCRLQAAAEQSLMAAE